MDYLKAETKYIRGEKALYAYREIGVDSGIPLLMLPHLSATMDNWDARFLNPIAKLRKVIVFDNQGVGASSGKVQKSIQDMAEGVSDFVQALNIKRFDLLGLSMGGFIAQEYLAISPEKVRKLILAGTGPRGGVGISKVSRVTYQDMIRSVIHRTDPKRFLFFNHDDEGKKYADDFLYSLNQRKENIDIPIKLSSFRAQLKAIKKWGNEASSDLSQIQQHTLIINGDNDRMVPTQNSFDLSEKIPNKNLEIYSNAGHGSIFQYPEESSDLINNFLS
ncbi:alpha/beta fold hydrolase [Lactococcus garvieae]